MSQRNAPLPTFLIIGTMKGGTSSLYHYLRQHPDVHMSTAKETHFFDYFYSKGIEHYRQHCFPGWNGERAVGEATPVYLSLPFVATRLKTHLPNVKMIALLRNPVECAYSYWWMYRSRGRDRLSFDEAIAENMARLDSNITFENEAGARRWQKALAAVWSDQILIRRYLDEGYYASHLERFFKLFPRKNIKIILSHEFLREPQKVIEDVCEFLGMARDFKLRDEKAQMLALSGLAVPVVNAIRRLGIDQQIGKLPSSVRYYMKRILSLGGKRPKMPESTHRMLREHYAPHNQRLSKLIKRDLSLWDE